MKTILLFLSSFLFFFIAKCLPFSYIIGSSGSFFSITTSACLLMAGQTNLWILSLFCVSLHTTSIQSLCWVLFHRLPLLFAGLSYRFSSMFISVFVPMVCMFLFIMHPIGQQVWLYSLYWLIPIVLYKQRDSNIFYKALGSVFVAHAVGSIIFLYTHTMQPEAWLALIPIVAIERLLMALTIVIGEYMIKMFKIFYSKVQFFWDRKCA